MEALNVLDQYKDKYFTLAPLIDKVKAWLSQAVEPLLSHRQDRVNVNLDYHNHSEQAGTKAVEILAICKLAHDHQILEPIYQIYCKQQGYQLITEYSKLDAVSTVDPCPYCQKKHTEEDFYYGNGANTELKFRFTEQFIESNRG